MRARCLVLRLLRLVAMRPVLPSQIGCQILDLGLPLVSTVTAVHRTMPCTRSRNSSSMSANDVTGSA